MVVLTVSGCARPLSTEFHQASHISFVYDLPPNITFALGSNVPGVSTFHQVGFDISMGELETFQAVLTYPNGFTFNGFTALGPLDTQIGTYGVDFDFDGTIDFTIPIRAVDQNNAYADRDLNGVFTPDLDSTIEHTVQTGAHIFTMVLPVGGDGDPTNITGPFNERATAKLFAGILVNPVTAGSFILSGSFTSVDPDTGDATDNQDHSPLNFTTSQTVNIGDTPSINPGGVVSGASFAPGAVAPGSIASVFGSLLASTTEVASAVPLPTTLGGATMNFGGMQAVPEFFASPLQVNIQIPWELAGLTQADLTDNVDGVTGNTETVTLASFSPGLFATNQQGAGQGAILIANTGGTVAAPVGAFPNSQPAVRGTDFIEIFCTGLGQVTNQPATGAAFSGSPLSETITTPTVTIGGVPATVTFSGGAPGFVGLYQANVEVPAAAPTGDAVDVVLTIGGVTANTVTIAVQ